MIRYSFLGLLLLAMLQRGDPDPLPCQDCPNPNEPWHRGGIHYACTFDGHPVDSFPAAANWKACSCQHGCSPELESDRAKFADYRLPWDPACEARCSPQHCHCQHPCSEGPTDLPPDFPIPDFPVDPFPVDPTR